jgi:hypothetical protein
LGSDASQPAHCLSRLVLTAFWRLRPIAALYDRTANRQRLVEFNFIPAARLYFGPD